MSCVVGMRKMNWTNKVINVGVVGDTCASNWSEQGTIAQSKIWNPNGVENLIIGLCGSIRELNVLERAKLVEPEKAPIETYDYDWVVETLVPNVMAALAENGAVNIEATQKYTMDSTLLVATECGLYTIQADFSVVEYDKDYLAIGAGATVANGVISALEAYQIDDDVENILELALTAVADNTIGVQLPATFIGFDVDMAEILDNAVEQAATICAKDELVQKIENLNKDKIKELLQLLEEEDEEVIEEEENTITEDQAIEMLNNLSENEQNEIIKLLKSLRKEEN